MAVEELLEDRGLHGQMSKEERKLWDTWTSEAEELRLLRSVEQARKDEQHLERLERQAEALEDYETLHYRIAAEDPDAASALAALKAADWSYANSDDPGAFRSGQAAVRKAMGTLENLWHQDPGTARSIWKQARGEKPFPFFRGRSVEEEARPVVVEPGTSEGERSDSAAPTTPALDLGTAIEQATVTELIEALGQRLEADAEEEEEELVQVHSVHLAALLVKLRESPAYRFAILHPLLVLSLGAL